MLPKELIYEGEFGSEIVLFLPHVRWLAKRGRLVDRVVSTYNGMSSFYDGLNIGRLIERDEPRRWVHPEDRPAWMPVKDEHNFDNRAPSKRLDFGNLREQFRGLNIGDRLSSFLSDKPTLIIHNKYAEEWDGPPINFITSEQISAIADLCEQNGHNAIYIRHGSRDKIAGYSNDHNTILQLGDDTALRGHRNVLDFHDAVTWAREDAGQIDVNAVKCAILSRSYKYLTVQGGGAHLMAMFNGSAMAILHRAGREEYLAYENGYYTFAANPAPKTLVFRDHANMMLATSALLAANIKGGGIVPRIEDAASWVDLGAANLQAQGRPTIEIGAHWRHGKRAAVRRALRRINALMAT